MTKGKTAESVVEAIFNDSVIKRDKAKTKSSTYIFVPFIVMSPVPMSDDFNSQLAPASVT